MLVVFIFSSCELIRSIFDNPIPPPLVIPIVNPGTKVCADTFLVERNLYKIFSDGVKFDKKDTIEIIEKYYCNQILISYEEGITPIEKYKAQKHLIDTLGLGRVDSCRCSNFEIWGKDAGIIVDPEDGSAKRNEIAQNGAGEIFKFNSSLNFIIDIPNYPPFLSIDSLGSDTIPVPITPGQTPFRIALIDSGIIDEFAELNYYRWKNQGESPNPNNIDDNIPSNCYADEIYGYNFAIDEPLSNMANIDQNGHGTHIAGIISGASIARDQHINLSIMDLKIFEQAGGDLFDLVCATNFAIDNGAKIINQSLGFYSSHAPQVLKDILMKADANNVLVVTSAGNDMLNNDLIQSIDPPNVILHHYPSDIDLDNIISVAAVSENNPANLWTGSEFGSNYGETQVDVAAPGENILSTFLGGTAKLSGTSMATGQITRVAAILKIDNPSLSPNNLKDCIINYYSQNQPINAVWPIRAVYGTTDTIDCN